MYQQLLVVLLSVYLTKPHLRTMPAFACKTHGPVTTRQNFKQQQGWCEEQNSTMSRTAKLAEGMDWTRVGEGASSAKAKSCVLVPCVGCSSMYLSEVHSTTFCPSHAIDCTPTYPHQHTHTASLTKLIWATLTYTLHVVQTSLSCHAKSAAAYLTATRLQGTRHA